MIIPNYLRPTGPWLADFDRLFARTCDRLQPASDGFRIHDSDGVWTLELDLPGVSKDRTEVEVRDDVLHIAVKDGDGPGTSHRLPLGKRVDAGAVTAKLESGVLSVRLPKAEAKRETLKIDIN